MAGRVSILDQAALFVDSAVSKTTVSEAHRSLAKALLSRQVGPGLIHHSDHGVQYASQDYIELLKEHEIWVSMSRRACPYDNLQAESFIKTLKGEKVYLNEYETLREARASMGIFLERVYNEERLHSALCYRPPAEIEQMLLQQPPTL